jgi:hypothetical protein
LIYEPYFEIPNNEQIFFDVIHRYSDFQQDLAYQYKDEIINDKLVSKLVKIDDENLKSKIGHHEIVFDLKKY